MRQVRPAIAMNLVVPGTGLILLGRPWLGLAIAVWFGLAGEMAVWGVLIAPATMPLAMTVAAGCLAAAAWLLAQRLLVMRVREGRQPGVPDTDRLE